MDELLIVAGSFFGCSLAITLAVWLVRQWRWWREFVRSAYLKMKGP